MNPEKSIVVCISYEWKQELVINRKLICSDVYSIFPSWLQLITNISALRFSWFHMFAHSCVGSSPIMQSHGIQLRWWKRTLDLRDNNIKLPHRNTPSLTRPTSNLFLIEGTTDDHKTYISYINSIMSLPLTKGEFLCCHWTSVEGTVVVSKTKWGFEWSCPSKISKLEDLQLK